MGDKVIQGAGRGYQIVLGELGASSVDWTVRVWVNTSDFWAVKESLTGEIKRQLDESGLDIPYPQMELHFANGEPAEPVDDSAGKNLFQPGAIKPRPRTDR
jgi:small conductance mechanosensitive channel